ncbi:hypothetical protein Nepgr_031958 [Nepenthes gracilis]|uniref:Uncharacterized protein n=1 Tax=Nepenthes gracilis TaxID=150966 RepID=A0AAD3TIE9_NEPGR|nr:hypothetical protein Nepgr_031958 [Nepenthes gracilis]
MQQGDQLPPPPQVLRLPSPPTSQVLKQEMQPAVNDIAHTFQGDQLPQPPQLPPSCVLPLPAPPSSEAV